MTLLLLAVLCLGAFRLTSLVTTDVLTARLRTRVLVRFPAHAMRRDGVRHGPSMIGFLVSCDACAGVWVSAGVLGVAWLVGLPVGGVGLVVWWPAVAGGQLVVSSLVRRLSV